MYKTVHINYRIVHLLVLRVLFKAGDNRSFHGIWFSVLLTLRDHGKQVEEDSAKNK